MINDSKRNFVAYRIKNVKNGRVYFGSTNDFKTRKSEHLKIMSGKGKGLPNYLRDIQLLQHTPDDFVFRVVARFDNREAMKAREQLLLNMYWGTVSCYNTAHEVNEGEVREFLIAWDMTSLRTKVYLSCHAMQKDLAIPKNSIKAMLKGKEAFFGTWVVERWNKKRTVSEVLDLYNYCGIKLPEHAMQPITNTDFSMIPGICSIANLVNRRFHEVISPSTGITRIRMRMNYQEQYW